MGLNASEKKTLAALQRKAEEPDEAPIGKTMSLHLDLSDEAAVNRAIEHGFITRKEAEEAAEEEEQEPDETPRRKGYFGDDK